MKKVLLVATVVRMHVNVFHIPMMKWFKENGWKTYVAARNDFDYPQECVIPYCDCFINLPFERFPVKPGNVTVYKNLKELIERESFDVIYCHTPVGGLLGRLAARKDQRSKVVYMAHGFHFYQGAPITNWLFYYPVEKIMSRYTDVLITINREDYEIASRKMKARKTYLVPGVGIDISKFRRDALKRTALRQKFSVKDDQYVLLSVGELSKRKNHQAVIRSLPSLPSTVHYYLCGCGSLDEELKELTSSLGISDRVHFLGFRSDVADFYNMADIFMFPSLQEGLPVSVMEAMANGLPVICSDIRGNADLINDGKGGYLVDSNDSVAYGEKISALISDSQLRKRMGALNEKEIQKYSQGNVLKQMAQIFNDIDWS